MKLTTPGATLSATSVKDFASVLNFQNILELDGVEFRFTNFNVKIFILVTMKTWIIRVKTLMMLFLKTLLKFDSLSRYGFVPVPIQMSGKSFPSRKRRTNCKIAVKNSDQRTINLLQKKSLKAARFFNQKRNVEFQKDVKMA